MRIYIPGLLAGFKLNSKSRAWLAELGHGSEVLCIESNGGAINRFALLHEHDGGNIVNFIACCLVGTPDDLEEDWLYDQETNYMDKLSMAAVKREVTIKAVT